MFVRNSTLKVLLYSCSLHEPVTVLQSTLYRTAEHQQPLSLFTRLPSAITVPSAISSTRASTSDNIIFNFADARAPSGNRARPVTVASSINERRLVIYRLAARPPVGAALLYSNMATIHLCVARTSQSCAHLF